MYIKTDDRTHTYATTCELRTQRITKNEQGEQHSENSDHVSYTYFTQDEIHTEIVATTPKITPEVMQLIIIYAKTARTRRIAV